MRALPRLIHWVGALLIVALWLAVLPQLAAAAALAVGDRVAYLDPATGETFCGTVTLLDAGPSGLPYVWMLPDLSSRFYFHVPASSVRPGCQR